MSQHIILDGSPRKCGTIKVGGCYGVGQMGSGGILKPWVWLAGKPQGNHLIHCDVPPRMQLLVNPRMTLTMDELWLSEWIGGIELHLNPRMHLQSLPTTGIADHVGAQYYTAAEFADECTRRGPSRRLSPQVAKQIAPHVPCPILFSHPDVPVFDRQDEFEVFVRACHGRYSQFTGEDFMKEREDYLAKFDKLPAVWADKRFGLTLDAPTWDDHPFATLMRWYGAWKGKGKPKVDRTETEIGISWLTKVVLVLKSDKDEVDPDLAAAGIVGAIIGKGEEDETENI